MAIHIWKHSSWNSYLSIDVLTLVDFISFPFNGTLLGSHVIFKAILKLYHPCSLFLNLYFLNMNMCLTYCSEMFILFRKMKAITIFFVININFMYLILHINSKDHICDLFTQFEINYYFFFFFLFPWFSNKFLMI